MNLSEVTVTEVCGIMTVHSKRGENTRMKNRPSYGLSLCYEGQITYKQNGREYTSKSDVALILPMGESYEIIRKRTGDFPVINFKTQEPLTKEIKVIEIHGRERIFKSFEEIKRLYVGGGNRMKIMSLFYEILDSLTSAREHGILEPAIKFIYDNFHCENINNSLLAEKCNLSEVYFRRLFKERLKTTPKQFIITLRIQKAKQLLKEGREKISVICERCGFSSQYHFCRAFKESVGVAPSEYRENHAALHLRAPCRGFRVRSQDAVHQDPRRQDP